VILDEKYPTLCTRDMLNITAKIEETRAIIKEFEKHSHISCESNNSWYHSVEKPVHAPDVPLLLKEYSTKIIAGKYKKRYVHETKNGKVKEDFLIMI
jgi:hypothetical protein